MLKLIKTMHPVPWTGQIQWLSTPIHWFAHKEKMVVVLYCPSGVLCKFLHIYGIHTLKISYIWFSKFSCHIFIFNIGLFMWFWEWVFFEAWYEYQSLWCSEYILTQAMQTTEHFVFRFFGSLGLYYNSGTTVNLYKVELSQ